MNIIRMAAISLMAFLVISCNDSTTNSSNNEQQVVTRSFDDFGGYVSGSVSSTAVDCGAVGIGESDIDTNTCVADSFASGLEFYAIYELQGIDSSVGAAITREPDGSVYVWSYDSNPSGGIPASSSRIDKDQCAQPVLSGTVDSGYSEIFTCTQ